MVAQNFMSFLAWAFPKVLVHRYEVVQRYLVWRLGGSTTSNRLFASCHGTKQAPRELMRGSHIAGSHMRGVVAHRFTAALVVYWGKFYQMSSVRKKERRGEGIVYSASTAMGMRQVREVLLKRMLVSWTFPRCGRGCSLICGNPARRSAPSATCRPEAEQSPRRLPTRSTAAGSNLT
jgi:hypothetical protein